MDTLDNKLPSVSVLNRIITIAFVGGLTYSFPADGNPRLAAATDKGLANVEVNAFGLHWPEVDEDLSFGGLSCGDYGQYVHSARSAA